jgi:hypothetical protein
MVGPVVPIGPALERELALIFEEHRDADDGDLAAAIVAFAFVRGLVVRSSNEPEIVHFPIGRDGTSRAVRVVDAPPPAPPSRSSPRKRGPEWTAAMPARRK